MRTVQQFSEDTMSTENAPGQSVGNRTVTRAEQTIAGIGTCRVYVTDEDEWYSSVTEITDFRPNRRKEHALRGF